MTKKFIYIYDSIKHHPIASILLFFAITLGLIYSMSRMHYKEDITDFLPLSQNQKQAFDIYQNISGSSRIFIVFHGEDTKEYKSPEDIIEAIEEFIKNIEDIDTNRILPDITTKIDIDKYYELSDFIYSNIPYFLTEKDISRIDSLLSGDGYIERLLEERKMQLLLSSNPITINQLQRDPLNLFSDRIAPLQNMGEGSNIELYDGYIFSPDMTRAIITLNSQFGSSETDQNSRMLRIIEQASEKTQASATGIEIHTIGGPIIAVGNSTQIKRDSILSITISSILIILLLIISFRSFRNILLVAVSIIWGGVFALGVLSFFRDSVSLIVIGIASVIVGIAVNYPLHLITHISHTPHRRQALKEIISPLLVGNITTVGAFLCLVFLQSVALQDLGLFSALLLVGTMIFSVVVLPHIVRIEYRGEKSIFGNTSKVSLEKKRWAVVPCILLTIVFLFFFKDAEFDPDITNINYMTTWQREDIANLQNLISESQGKETVYIISQGDSIDEALDKNMELNAILEQYSNDEQSDRSRISDFLCSKKERQNRLNRWQSLIYRHRERLTRELLQKSLEAGFAEESFREFFQLIDKDFTPQTLQYFQPIARSLFSSNIAIDTVDSRYNIVEKVQIDTAEIEDFHRWIHTQAPSHQSFDIKSMNSSIAEGISANFNYIGWACSFIVFIFLWLSFGSIELALISFLPMAISWVWILGLMAIFGIEFNIVNIILATFIFGQGDDYTIFMTEGNCHSYAYRSNMLASYRNSIIHSALIMFIGIGTLIFAKHPALHSLAEVTIIGMLSVVMMAFIVPPLVFRFLVEKGGSPRVRPITLQKLLSPIIERNYSDLQKNIACLKDRYLYRGTEVYREMRGRLRANDFYRKHIEAVEASDSVLVINCGVGELPILIALTQPTAKIYAFDLSPEYRRITEVASEGLSDNIFVIDNIDESLIYSKVFLLRPTEEQEAMYRRLNPTIIR